MPLEKRSVSLSGHRTSIALEPAFWTVLERMAGPAGLTALVAGIDAARTESAAPGRGEALASALRVAALTFAQTIAAHPADGPKTGPHRQESEPCHAPPCRPGPPAP